MTAVKCGEGKGKWGSAPLNCLNKAMEPHICPFRNEIEDDAKTLCRCCSECEHECAMDIQGAVMEDIVERLCEEAKHHRETGFLSTAELCLEASREIIGLREKLESQLDFAHSMAMERD